jgi:NADPH:quinone reductase
MRALLSSGQSDVLVTIAHRPDPVPADDEIVVRVEAFSLNRADLLHLNMPNSQWRVGIDFAGTVIRAAGIGRGPAVGARVMAHNPAGGGAAELATASVHRVVVLPSQFEFAAAAALPLAGLTAYRLINEAKLKAGSRMLITGATGGVGHLAVELAIKAGAEVVALVRRKEAARRLQEFGASVITWIAGAAGTFNVVLESVGGAVMAEAVGKLAPRGLVLWFGEASGQPVTLDFFSMFGGHESMSLRHFVYSDVEGANDAEDLATLVRLVLNGELHPEVDRVAGWEETAIAMGDMKAGRLQGKAVFVL